MTAGHFSRRQLLWRGGAGLAALAAARGRVAARDATPAGARGDLSETALSRFEADIEAALGAFRMAGAAVAVVDRDGVRFGRGFGVRDLISGEPVTPDTHFLVASTTKSMTSLLVAAYVDDRALAWDQPVREVWPDFRAPTDDLTRALRVRDLLGMATGIGEPPWISTFHEGDPTAGDLLRSLATLPVIAPPQTTFFYNNTVYAAGGYLPALLEGASEADLGMVYARLMAERVYGPAGMTTARIADDPRPFVANYATGYGPDFLLGTAAQPYGAVGSYAPVGGTLATLTDMAAYIAMQLNGGVSVSGGQVVTGANLAACWQPRIAFPVSAALEPDLVRAGYGMGWISQTYRDGQRLVWHNGGIDGFSTFIGFFPDDGLGLVILTNIGPLPRGLFFTAYVLNLLLGARFGLNRGANEAVLAQYQAAEQRLRDLAAQAEPMDADAIAPYLGHYERGWQLAFDADGPLRLRQGSRAIPLLALPDGAYVMASGVLPGNLVHFSRDETGALAMEIQDIETVRWTVGLE